MNLVLPRQLPSRGDNAKTEEDGEPERDVRCACAKVERDAGFNHRKRKSYVDRNEQVRRCGLLPVRS